MDAALKEIYTQVERYVVPLIGGAQSFMSKEENRILALQQINRLNQRIGLLARTQKDQVQEMKALQVHVNNLTIGVKNDNVGQIKHSLTLVRNYVWPQDD